jgi:hypothetical protein
VDEYRKEFEEYGTLYLRQILDEKDRKEALLELLIAKENNEYSTDDMGFKVCFGDKLNYLLSIVQPTLEKLLNVELYPTYSYSRIYQKGEKLHLHVDRNACEVSVTITLGYGGASVWPFVILPRKETLKCFSAIGIDGELFEGNAINPEDPSKLQKIIINSGDGILYKGMELAHGRDEYVEGDWQAQVFLHYVYANGKNKHHKYDEINKYKHHEYDEINNLISEIIKGIYNGTRN